MTQEFLKILNKARKDSLLEPVMIDKDLSRAARYHSYDQATQNYIGHDTYDRNPETDSLEFVCDVHARTEKFLITNEPVMELVVDVLQILNKIGKITIK